MTAYSSADSPSSETLRGAALLGIAVLAQNAPNTPPPLPPDIATALTPWLDQLPPQWITFHEVSGLGDWINLAALIEAYGLRDDAWDLLTAVGDAFRRSTPLTTSGLNRDAIAARCTPEVVDAFIAAKRGRIARLAGHLDTAEQYYRDALRLAPAQPSGVWATDSLPYARLGLAVLAVERGNYPQARQRAHKALALDLPIANALQAHMLLGLIERKCRRYDHALDHLWQAYDLIPPGDSRRLEALAGLGEVAADQGRLNASLRARLAVLAQPVLPRLMVPVLGGMLDVFAQLATRPDGEAAEELIAGSTWGQQSLAGRQESTVAARLVGVTEAMLSPGASDTSGVGGTVAPHDVVVLQLGLSRLLIALDATNRAAQWIDQAESIARDHAFHERMFQVDQLRGQLTQQSTGSRAYDPSRMEERHHQQGDDDQAPHWQRFASLSVTAAGVGP